MTDPTSRTRPIRLKPDELQFLNRQLASMARLNMPIAKGLRILARDVKSEDFKALVQAVQQDLDEGLSLPDALAKYPETFSSLQLEVIKAGESTGNLSVILDELNAHSAAMKKIKSRVLEAVTYPIVLLGVMFVFVIFFLKMVAPQFRSMLAAGGKKIDLPWLTEALFGLSALVENPLVLGILIAVFLGGAVFAAQKLAALGEEYDDFLFRIWLFGPLFERAALMKVTRTMRDLLNNGVSMVETLRLTANTVGRNRIQEKLNQLRSAVEEGGSFSKNLAGGEVFPDTMVWKLQMAEEKGIIEQALEELAAEFEVKVDEQTTVITKVLAPMMLIGMALVVLLMFIACFVPLTELH